MSRAAIAAALVLVARAAHGAEPEAPPSDDVARWQDGASGVEPAPEVVPPASTDAEQLSPSSRAPAIAAAIVPGLAVHGTGHRSIGKSATADHLLTAEGIGFGLMLAGVGGLAATGASRYTVAPFALLGIGGTALFASSWLADVYGVSVVHARGLPSRRVPRVESALGWRYVYDPQFAYRHFLVESVDLRLGRLKIAPSAWFALDDRNARLRGALGWRFWGPEPDAPAWPLGSFSEAEVAVTHHRYGSDGFSILTFEAFALARRDLAAFDPELSGAFGELGVGWALQRFDYHIPGMDVPSDTEQMLLARIAFGIYLADPDRQGGELVLYYDHRHDDYAAGLHMTGLGSGVLGHFGLLGRYFFENDIGIVAETSVGSAWIAGLSLAVRSGGGR